jgi:hypothetical protein
MSIVQRSATSFWSKAGGVTYHTALLRYWSPGKRNSKDAFDTNTLYYIYYSPTLPPTKPICRIESSPWPSRFFRHSAALGPLVEIERKFTPGYAFAYSSHPRTQPTWVCCVERERELLALSLPLPALGTRYRVVESIQRVRGFQQRSESVPLTQNLQFL